jgi:transcriptional regulator GlxA family with amidase domain
MTEPPIRIGLLAYDGFQTLDLTGPLDAFDSANSQCRGAYATVTVSLDGAPVASEPGLRILPDCALDDAGALDTLLVPGGAGLRRPEVAGPIAAALRRVAPSLRRVVSICTGIYGVAAAGLLDGRRATTHWLFAADIRRRFPAIRLEPDAIYVVDAPLYSSAGITAAVDLSLALIEEDYGPAMALAVARDLVVYLKRTGGQRQYSEPLRFQTLAVDGFAELSQWVAAHLAEDLTVEALAARAGLGVRQFSRRFKQVFGVSPGQQIEALRLDAARDHLTGSRAAVETIARMVGFNSSDAFRRAFDRQFGLSPTDYRHRFGPALSAPEGDKHAHPPPDQSRDPSLDPAARRRRAGS